MLDAVKKFILDQGYQLATGSMAIAYEEARPKWHFVIIALHKKSGKPLPEIGHDLALFDGIESFQLSHARN
jgi:putative Mg2+ transporter-C (MgtC) family protein